MEAAAARWKAETSSLVVVLPAVAREEDLDVREEEVVVPGVVGLVDTAQEEGVGPLEMARDLCVVEAVAA